MMQRWIIIIITHDPSEIMKVCLFASQIRFLLYDKKISGFFD